ncbi:MAG: glycosyltransferase family 39 protein [Planctomycetes bacterium]|nr:glycosyltransferase family 39 protein [Planctomycetota bacterium]MCC7172855.1 glycosyltransferase family 39 protein [Planctomycetota bacterium]
MSDAAARATPAGAASPTLGVGVLFAVVVAALVRVPFLFGYGIDDDEFYTLRNAETLLATPTPDAVSHFPLSFAATRACIEWFGLGQFGLRLVPVVTGVLAVWALARVGRRVVGERAGVSAALVLALWPWHQYYSGLARYYAPLFLAAIFVLDASWRVIERKEWKALPLGLVALGLGSLVHPSLPLSLGGAVGLRGARRKRGMSLTRPLLAILAVGVVFVTVASLAPEDSPIKRVLSGAGGHGYDAARLGFGLAFNVTTVVFALAAIGAVAIARRAPAAFVFLVSATALPLVTLIALTLVGSEVQPRYAMAGMPALVLLAGVGLDALVPVARARLATASACLLPLVPGVISHLADGDRHPVPQVARALATRVDARDLLIAEGHSLLLATLYGAERHPRAGEGEPPFPRYVGEWPPTPDVLAVIDQFRPGAWFVVPENLFASPRENELAAVEWLRSRAIVADRIGESRLDYHRNGVILLHVPRGGRG